MKIALIKPYFDMIGEVRDNNSRQFPISFRIENYPPLGLCYIASYLQQNGITDVEVIDCVSRKYKSRECCQYILRKEFDIVGISLTSFDLKEGNNIIQELKSKKNNIIIVLGGVHVTYHPEIVYLLGADFGIRGDGEDSFYKFLVNFNYSIDGLVYIKDNKLYYNEPAKISDLNILPYPLTLKHKYTFPIFTGKIYTSVTSRGCIYNCLFCGVPHKGEYRQRDAKNILGELIMLKKKGYDYVDFKDDCFTIDRDKIVELCNLIIKSRINIFWGAETRADLVDFELLSLMKRANCHNLRFGIESGVDMIRNKVMGKRLRKEDIEKAIRQCKELGIKSIVYILLGSPSETIENMKESISFVKKLAPDYLDVSLITPLVGSRLYDIYLKEKEINDDIWDKVAKGISNIPLYVPKDITLTQMRLIQRYAYLQHYFNIKNIIREIRQIRNLKDFLHKLKIAFVILTGNR